MWQILIVDDEPDVRLVLEIELKNAFSCDVIQAESAKGATNLLRSKPFHIVISDMCMADDTGLDIFNFLREENFNIPMILFTGSPPDLPLSPTPPLAALVLKPNFRQLLTHVQKQLA